MTAKEGKLIYLMKNNSSFVLFYILQVINCCFGFFLATRAFYLALWGTFLCVVFHSQLLPFFYGWMSCARSVRAKKIKSNL